MTDAARHLRLDAGAPLRLPWGLALLPIGRTRMELHARGRWRGCFVRREPYALVLRGADGALQVLAAGAEAASPSQLAAALPQWEALVHSLDSAQSR
jgi:hypothetical protein